MTTIADAYDESRRTYGVVKLRPEAALRQIDKKWPERGHLIIRDIPEEFPVIFHLDRQMPVRPIMRWMLLRYYRRKKDARGVKSLNTARAHASDLCGYLNFLDQAGKIFEIADQRAFDRYIRALGTAPMPLSGRIRTTTTIARTAASIASFYKWSGRAGSTVGQLDRALTASHGRRSDREVNPLTPEEFRRLLPVLGPLPSERIVQLDADRTDGTPPRRDVALPTTVPRLIAEMAVRTGLRRIEMTSLTVGQILALTPDPDQPDQSCALTLHITKGMVPRPAWIPSDLVAQLLLYIDHERAEVEKSSGRRASTRLFLNGPQARQHSGKPLRPENVTAIFLKAFRRAGLLRVSADDDRGTVSDHTLHDLRHTFAVWSAIGLMKHGISNPWKRVQARLGHKSMATTETIYLRYIDRFENDVSDLLNQSITEMRNK